MRNQKLILAALLIFGFTQVDARPVLAQQRSGLSVPVSKKNNKAVTNTRATGSTPARTSSAGSGPSSGEDNTPTPLSVSHSTAKPKVIEIPNDKLLPAPTNLPDHQGSFSDIGRGTAIIFTPDLAAPGNRQFYQALGFLYLEDSSWPIVLEQIIRHNQTEPDNKITRIVLETHGSWGDGLKLQEGKENNANRSYISLGAIQERLENTGVKELILSACNSGRLLRPEIYYRLDKRTLLPANRGMYNASKSYRPNPNSVKILRRRDSRFEALTPLYVSELPKILRRQMGVDNGEVQLVVSDLFLEYTLQDPNLVLIDAGFVRQTSIHDYSVERSESLISRFFALLNQIAQRETERDPIAKEKATARPTESKAAAR